MLRKLDLGAEKLIARLAHIGLILLMYGLHMLLEMWKLRESRFLFHTEWTLERLLTRMLPDMQLEDTRVGKSLPANLAIHTTMKKKILDH